MMPSALEVAQVRCDAARTASLDACARIRRAPKASDEEVSARAAFWPLQREYERAIGQLQAAVDQAFTAAGLR